MEKDNQKKRKRNWAIFKTLKSRVHFAVSGSIMMITGLAVYSFWSEYVDTSPAPIPTPFIVVAGFILASSLAYGLSDWIITRRATRFVDSLKKVISGELEPGDELKGMAEFDGLAEMFNQLVSKLTECRTSIDQQVKSRTSLLSLSKGLTELEKARTEALLASIGEGVVAVDQNARVTFLNKQAVNALWWQAEKVTGISVFDAYRLEDDKGNIIESDAWPIWQALHDKKTVVTSAPAKPFYLRRRDKSAFPVKISITPITLAGEAVGALLAISDITAEVEFDQRKSEFISIASHQLRSPSSAVKFMADMMRKGDFGELTPKQKEWVEKLYLASDSMLDLVNELLNVSRIEAGVKMEPREQDVNLFMTDAIKLCEPMLLERHQTIAYSPTELPKLTFDHFSMSETMKNLIGNASKYSPDAAVITIVVTPREQDVMFSITDQGIGIPRAAQEQIFSKFFRADNALSSAKTGTGLGLYYCKSAVEKHGGRIGFTSEEGKGSTFWFTMPIKKPESLKG